MRSSVPSNLGSAATSRRLTPPDHSPREALAVYKEAAQLARSLGSTADLSRAALGAEETEFIIFAWPWLAHSKHEFALALIARGRPEDRSRAQTLLAEATASAERIGMPALQKQIRVLRE